MLASRRLSSQTAFTTESTESTKAVPQASYHIQKPFLIVYEAGGTRLCGLCALCGKCCSNGAVKTIFSEDRCCFRGMAARTDNLRISFTA